MKKIISLAAIAVVLLAMAGCAVNDNTGRIYVSNMSDKAANGLKLGSVNIGYLAPGTSTTLYFYKAEDAAAVTAEGFNVYSDTKTNTINLKLNYEYSLRLFQDSTDTSIYKFIVNGSGNKGATSIQLIDKN